MGYPGGVNGRAWPTLALTGHPDAQTALSAPPQPPEVGSGGSGRVQHQQEVPLWHDVRSVSRTGRYSHPSQEPRLLAKAVPSSLPGP